MMKLHMGVLVNVNFWVKNEIVKIVIFCTAYAIFSINCYGDIFAYLHTLQVRISFLHVVNVKLNILAVQKSQVSGVE